MSRVCRVAEDRRSSLCAYIRWSAIRSASVASRASWGRITAPWEALIANPSPCSESAAAASAMIVFALEAPVITSTQNSSPPIL
jgi:hypothetical protein